jgi:hypothetical protein
MLLKTRPISSNSPKIESRPEGENMRTISIVATGLALLFGTAFAIQHSWLGTMPQSIFHQIRLAAVAQCLASHPKTF